MYCFMIVMHIWFSAEYISINFSNVDEHLECVICIKPNPQFWL
jgi:hypothetical protein